MYDTRLIKLDSDFVSLQHRVHEDIVSDIDYEIFEEHIQKIDIQIRTRVDNELIKILDTS